MPANWRRAAKASLILLTDYRGGALGRISLETPATRTAMLSAAEPVVADVDAAPESV